VIKQQVVHAKLKSVSVYLYLLLVLLLSSSTSRQRVSRPLATVATILTLFDEIVEHVDVSLHEVFFWLIWTLSSPVYC